jgi:hypothetical protein
MKKIFIASIGVLLYACNAEEKTTPAGETKVVSSASDAISNMSGYEASYSKSFEMGEAKNAEAVLALWKDWDNGNLEPSKALFADSVSFLTSDGSVIAGPIDSAFGAMKSYREMFTTIKSTVSAIFPVKSTDKNENWVCIWGKEINTDKKGKTDSVFLQETWRFNKEGKINLLLQHMRVLKPAKASK